MYTMIDVKRITRGDFGEGFSSEDYSPDSIVIGPDTQLLVLALINESPGFFIGVIEDMMS
jgi:hypothetical protein